MTSRDHRMDDTLWDEVWERNLGHVERHNVALSVWRRQAPEDPFAVLVGWELAHRWRARARNLAVLYGLWAVFWALMAYAGRAEVEPPGVGMPLTVTAFGVIGVALCLAFRARMRPIIEGRTGFAAAGPYGNAGSGQSPQQVNERGGTDRGDDRRAR